MINLIAPEVIERSQQRLRAELGLDQPAPQPVNEGAVRQVFLPEMVMYRGVLYTGAPLPYLDGIKMQGLKHRFTALSRQTEETPEVLADTLAAINECTRIFHSHLRPVNWLHRLFYRLLPNEFVQASEQEVSALLSFFLMCRMRSTVRPFP